MNIYIFFSSVSQLGKTNWPLSTALAPPRFFVRRILLTRFWLSIFYILYLVLCKLCAGMLLPLIIVGPMAGCLDINSLSIYYSSYIGSTLNSLGHPCERQEVVSFFWQDSFTPFKDTARPAPC